MTGNAAQRPGKASTFPGLILLTCLIALLAAYLFVYLSVRTPYIMDNMFLVIEYPGGTRSTYRLIEYYRAGNPENLAGAPVDARTPLSALEEEDLLNLETASRSTWPPGFRFFPLFFYPLERLEITFRIETEGPVNS